MDHTSHRLTYAGLSRRESVFLLYITAFVLGLLAVFVTQATIFEGYLVGGAVLVTGVIGLWRLELPPFWPPRAAPTRD
jgi:hypothetical protein